MPVPTVRETYGEARGRISTGTWVVLALVVLAGLAVRCVGLGEPVVGYHSFNEGFYLDLARQYATKGFLAPWIAPIDTNNPPVYPFLLGLATSLAGSGVAVARMLSVLAALATSVSLFFLGRRLYGEVAGLAAATIMALSPGAVLVGRNIQIDAVLALVLTPYALVTLAGKKLGYWSSAGVVEALRARGIDTGRTSLAIDEGVRGAWDPALKMYSDGLRIVTNPLAPGEVIPPGDPVVTLDPEVRSASADTTLVAQLDDVHVSPVFFGWAVDQNHDAAFYFHVLDPTIRRVGPWYEFGLARRAQPGTLWLYLLSPEYADKVRASQIATPAP